MRKHALALFAVATLSLVACRAQTDTGTTDSSAASSVTQQVMTDDQDFDRIGYISRVYNRSGKQYIVFDEAEWQSGAVSNPDVEEETLIVQPGSPIRMLGQNRQTGETINIDASFRGLETSLNGTGSLTNDQYAKTLFWINEEGGTVTAIKEQAKE